MKRFREHVEQYSESADLVRSMDILNNDIEELNTIVEDNEDLQVKVNAIAAMINKGRLYSATVSLSMLNDIWQKMDAWEERFIVWEKPRSDTRKLVGKP